MTLILVFVLLFCSNVKSISTETTTDESPRDVFDTEMDIDCNAKYKGFLVNSEEIFDIDNKKQIQYKCLNKYEDSKEGEEDENGKLKLDLCAFEYNYCTDGSLRQVNSKHIEETTKNIEVCVRNEKTIGADIKQTDCNLIEKDHEIENSQKWEIIKIGNVFQEVESLIDQQKVNIKNKDGKCLTAVTGNKFKMRTCVLTNNKQKFYFRSRGTVLKQGKLYNLHNKKCVNPAGSSLEYGTHTNYPTFGSCDGNTAVKYYANGEIVAYDKCLTSKDYNSVELEVCSMNKKQKWEINKCNKKGSCLIRNAATRKCLLDPDHAYLYYGTCTLGKNTFFDFVNGDWNARKTDWVKLSCNQDGKISVEIKNEIKLEKGGKTQTGVDVEIGGTTPFIAVDLSTTTSFEWEKAWEESFHSTVKSSMTCDHYEDSLTDDDNFTHGCIWQLKFTTFNRELAEKLEWRPPVVKCTRSGEPPKCDVFMKCGNKECDKCIHENNAVKSAGTLSPKETLGRHLRQKNLRRPVHK